MFSIPMKTRSGRVLYPINITLSSVISALEAAIASLNAMNRKKEAQQVSYALRAVRKNLK